MMKAVVFRKTPINKTIEQTYTMIEQYNGRKPTSASEGVTQKKQSPLQAQDGHTTAITATNSSDKDKDQASTIDLGSDGSSNMVCTHDYEKDQ